MRFTNNMYTRAGMVLAMTASMRALSFAGNTISDVPASANENRTIQQSSSLYTGTCDISQDLGFYDRSPIYLRIAQPKGPVSYVFDKTATYVLVYGGNVFGGTLKFPYVTNFVPSTAIDTSASNILTVDATGSTFSGGAITTPRNQVAGQVVTKNNERSVIANSAGATLNGYYLRSSDLSYHTYSMKVTINPNLTQKTACTNYYVARCGDGIIDTTTGSTNDGAGGIKNQAGTFLPRHTRSVKPNEICDDGALNGTAGHCNKDCTGNSTGTIVTGAAGCTITASASAITGGETVTINASYTSGAIGTTISPALSGFSAFTYPAWNGSATDTPATTTTYTLNVHGITGVSDTSCSTTVTVTPPTQHLQCTLSISPNPAFTGTIVAIGWNVTGGTFVGTDIFVNPLVAGRPHRVNTNEYSGVTSVFTTTTGDYVFSMMVHNNYEQAVCTGILHVIDRAPSSCSLTTTTPTIMSGQTAILNASYLNASLATMTPNIMGLNFTYPNRSNTGIAVTPTSTTTYTLTTLGIMGMSGSTCSVTINVLNTGAVNFSKSLVANVPYQSGANVTFRIDFSNLGSSIVHNVTITDNLPLSLEYAYSQIYGVSPYTFSTGKIGSYDYVQYSGFSLAPGQAGYILVVGKLKGYGYTDFVNNAFFYSDEVPFMYGAAQFTPYSPSGTTTFTKTSDKASYALGENARFTLAVTNNGPDPISNVTITDTRPNLGCITPDITGSLSNLPITIISTTNPYAWNYNGSLAVGQTFYLYITGHVSTTPSCVGNYTNNAGISYTVNGHTQTGTTSYNFSIGNNASSTMGFQKNLLQYGNNPGDPVVFELVYQNNGTATITNYDIVDYRPGTLNFVSANPMPATQTATSGGMLLKRIFTTPLAPNGSGKITVNGTIK